MIGRGVLESALRNVVFTAPFPMETTLLFARAVRGLDDVRLLGIFQQAPEGAARGWFDDVIVIKDGLDPEQIAQACKVLMSKHGRIHRLLGVLEDLQVQVAMVREWLGIEGPTVEVARRFRDKAHMKDVLRAAGVPVARHAHVRSDRDGWAFAEQVGFPFVLKPPAGAGSRATYRIDGPQDLAQALAEVRPAPDRVMLGEEFLTGAEHTFETLTIGGEPMFHSIGRYYPGPLEVMRQQWIQWVVVLPRDISGREFDDTRATGKKVIQALGLVDGMTHMEWFRRPDGSLAVGEIAARPPGAQIVKLMGHAHGADLYRGWARAVVDRAFDGPYERKWSTGIAFLRGVGEGRVAKVDGIEDAQRRMGHLVVEARLPTVGAPRASGYEGEGWAIVRHEDTEVVKKALFDLITTVRVTYTG